jgi:predicted ATPase/class 3 adenylate cyclase
MGETAERPPATVAEGLPRGTVTFLFTDIEGSTRLFQRLGGAYSTVLDEHRRLLETAIRAEGGHIVDAAGDGLFVAFADHHAALSAASAAQLSLRSRRWPEGVDVRVRMGLHSGSATPTGNNYVALAVHQAARIAAAAHGGQVLVSEVTRAMAEHEAVEDAAFIDLGLHRLKDFDRPQRLYQLVHPALPREFPAIRTLSGAAHNLPVSRSTFVGRDREMTELQELVDQSGLVTLVGPGGVGKTRLALEVAAAAAPRYRDGVWLTDLAPLAEEELVVATVAAAMGVREEPLRPLIETLAEGARSRQTLVILDNCEHIIDACAALAERLLRAAPELTILATSRQPLGVDGERVWPVQPLELPPAGVNLSAEAFGDVDAVRLFVARANAAAAHFALTDDNASAVAELCRRLDGMPLAIELAAARTRTLSPQQMIARLNDRFDLLTSGPRTAVPRHQTLRAAIDWSHELLAPGERALFRRLAVFAGGFSLEATESVCAGGGVESTDVVRLLSALVDRSLVARLNVQGEPRYGLLETMRGYAAEALAAAGEERAVRDAHLTWAMDFAESMSEALAPQRVAQKETLDRVELEHDNIRQALSWAVQGQSDAGLRIVAAIGGFWRMRGYMEEGRRWAESVAAAAPEGDLRLRAQAAQWAGTLALHQGDVRGGQPLLEEAIAAFRTLGDARHVAHGLEQLSWLAIDHDSDWGRAENLVRQTIAIHAEIGDDHLGSEALSHLALVKLRRGDEQTAQRLMDEALGYNLRHSDDPCPVLRERAGIVALLRGDLERARELLEEALSHNRETGQRPFLAAELGWLGETAFLNDDIDGAGRYFAEQLSTGREQGLWIWVRHALMWLTKVAIRKGDLMQARSAMDEVHRMSRNRGSAVDPEEVEAEAGVLAAEGRPASAARALSAAAARREMLGEPVPPAYRRDHERLMGEVASSLGPEAFSMAWTHRDAFPNEEGFGSPSS